MMEFSNTYAIVPRNVNLYNFGTFVSIFFLPISAFCIVTIILYINENLQASLQIKKKVTTVSIFPQRWCFLFWQSILTLNTIYIRIYYFDIFRNDTPSILVNCSLVKFNIWIKIISFILMDERDFCCFSYFDLTILVNS
jgi:hypothetical protein